MSIRPIDSAARDRVVTVTRGWIERAAALYDRRFPMLPVQFDLIGRTAGMYRVDRRGRVIRYNPFLFAKYFSDNLATTVPHEVAHYVVDLLHGVRRVRPHGHEWQAVMDDFRVDPRRRAAFELDGVPQRRQRRFAYRCRCRDHSLSTRAHNRLHKARIEYLCKLCGEPLRPARQCGT
jgi:SprT protein